MRRVIVTIMLVIMFSGCSYSEFKLAQHKSDVEVTDREGRERVERVEVEEEVAEDETVADEVDLSFAVNLSVPFYSQAPYGDWGMPYQEACEEASLLLAWYYVNGEWPSIDEFEADELAMVDWEVSYFGQYEHTTIEQTAEMASEYLGWDSWEILENPTVEDLKREIWEGNPIVAPFAGRYLGNPYFTGLGPVYHMLVIKGYDDQEFITNDVGTRHGENFTYSYNTLINALHDWDDSAAYDDEGILNGAKKVLVLKSS